VNDGEKMRFTSLLDILKTIAGHVTIPVSADIEGGYAANDEDLDKNIRLLIATGIIGINIEDTDTATNTIRTVDEQCRRIRQIRKTADATGIPLFINARTDVFIHAKNFETDELRYQEALKRGLAYKEAGADCFYPIVMRDITHIQRMLKAVDMPVNLLTIAGLPDLHTLNEMGVARVSLGPSFLKIAIQAMKGLALKLKDFDGLKEIVSNEITTDYLENLVTGKR
jgi:2-methylisocitrate lyase-like PEP mutase family enzyme